MPSGVQADATKRHAITAGMNLSVLRRLDPAVTAVLYSSSQVAVYELPNGGEGEDSGGWERCDIEGALYIVSRTPANEAEALYRVVVVNRKSRENFVDDITPGGMEFETVRQMIMFKNAAGRVLGLWFYVADEMSAVYKCMKAVVDGNLPLPPPVAPVPASTVQAPAVPPRNENKQPSSTSKRKAGLAPPASEPVVTTSPEEKAVGDSGPADSLARFFPNLKLTNGVAGESPPATAKRAPAVVENRDAETNGHVVAAEDATPADTRVPASAAQANPVLAHTVPNGVQALLPAMPVIPPAVLPQPHFAPGPASPAQYHHALMMNMSMLQRQDMVLANQLQQAAMHASSHSLTDSQQSIFHQRHLQNIHRQQVATRQHIAQLQPQLAMAQSQASLAGLHAMNAVPIAHVSPTGSPPRPAPMQNGDFSRATEVDDGPPSAVKNAHWVGVAVAGVAQEVGLRSIPMDRSQFRGLLQRLLSDKKLFESAFLAYSTA
jgi:Dcp1-like decapping family